MLWLQAIISGPHVTEQYLKARGCDVPMKQKKVFCSLTSHPIMSVKCTLQGFYPACHSIGILHFVNDVPFSINLC
jgi:hypothetical protein